MLRRLNPAPPPVAVQYCATFLKPEMLHIYRQITGLRRFHARVITQKREHAAAFPFDDLIVIPKPATHQLRRFWQKSLLGQPIQIYESEARRLEAELRRSQAAVLHIYFGHIGVMLLPLIRRSPCPVVVSFHGADGLVDAEKPAHRRATKEMLAKVSLVFARSESLVERIVALGCPREKIRVHRTGIPLEELPLVPRETPPDGAWHFVQACRLIEKKGLHTTLRAFAGFASSFPNATLTIAGDGPLRLEMQARAQESGVGDRTFFPGFLAQSALRDLYYRSHVFMHPSQLGADGNQEGVPNAMLEAMATGLPVIATNHGGIPEAVESGVSGLLVAEGDFHAAEKAMRQLAAHAPMYQIMSREAAASVARNYVQSAQIQTLENYYEEALRLGKMPFPNGL